MEDACYLLPPLLPALASVPALLWPAGLRASLLLEPELMPVVVPVFILLDFTWLDFMWLDFILESVAPGPTLPSLEAPGAGCIWADAIAVAPNNETTTRAEMASLDRMRYLLLWIVMRG